MPIDLLEKKEKKPKDLLQKQNLLNDPIGTLSKSGGQFVSDIYGAVSHPIETGKAIGNLGIGVVQKAIPGEQGKEVYANELGKFYANRYGSIEKAKDTALEDPIGFLSDLSIVFTGGGGALKGLGKSAQVASKTGKVSRIANVGKTLTKVGRAIDPLEAAVKGTGGLIKAATKGRKIAPLASKVNNPILKAAKNSGIDLPASAISDSRVVPLVESLTAKGFFGNKLSAKVQTAYQKLLDIGDDIVKKTGQSGDLAEAGDAIVKGTQKFKNRFYDVKTELYKKANFAKRAKDIKVNPSTKTLRFVNDILKNKTGAKNILGSSDDIKFFSDIKDVLKKKKSLPKEIRQYEASARAAGNVDQFVLKYPDVSEPFLRDVYKKVKKTQANATDVRSAIQEISKKVSNMNDQVATGNKAELRKLAALLENDLMSSISVADPKLASEISRANRFFSLSINELNSHFGKQIMKYADQPDKILPAILKNTTSKNDVKRIYRLIGKENINKVQSAFVKQMLDGAKNPSTGLFTPQGISKQIKSFSKDKLQKVLTQDQISKLDDISKISEGLGRFEKVASGSQTMFTARVATIAGSAFGMSPLAAAQLLLGDAVLSKIVSSRSGQALLTSGWDLTGRTGQSIINKSQGIGRYGRIGRGGNIIRESIKE